MSVTATRSWEITRAASPPLISIIGIWRTSIPRLLQFVSLLSVPRSSSFHHYCPSPVLLALPTGSQLIWQAERQERRMVTAILNWHTRCSCLASPFSLVRPTNHYLVQLSPIQYGMHGRRKRE